MKKILVFAFLLATLVGFSQEKDAVKTMQFFKNELQINADQETKLNKIVNEYFDNKSALEKSNLSAKDLDKSGRLSYLNENYNTEVQNVLSAKQFAKYQKLTASTK
ncbi:hypothetical protein ACFS5J_05855 [Flavobacterium chuncheonense]|uniref:Uncharacterized protein n=1 Tax=Flavobacterium chuncheonense TaxID=2026653 RepID=A0ABW5YKG9_9FLAO